MDMRGDPRASFKADLEKRLFCGPPAGHPAASTVQNRTPSREHLNQTDNVSNVMYHARNMPIRETAILDCEPPPPPVRDGGPHHPYGHHQHHDPYHTSRTSPNLSGSAYRSYLTKKAPPDFRTFSPPNKTYQNSTNPGREYLHMTTPRSSNYRPPPGSEGNTCILKLEGSHEISKDVMV